MTKIAAIRMAQIIVSTIQKTGLRVSFSGTSVCIEMNRGWPLSCIIFDDCLAAAGGEAGFCDCTFQLNAVPQLVQFELNLFTGLPHTGQL